MNLLSTLKKDIRVVFERDPAAKSIFEVLLWMRHPLRYKPIVYRPYSTSYLTAYLLRYVSNCSINVLLFEFLTPLR